MHLSLQTPAVFYTRYFPLTRNQLPFLPSTPPMNRHSLSHHVLAGLRHRQTPTPADVSFSGRRKKSLKGCGGTDDCVTARLHPGGSNQFTRTSGCQQASREAE
ncbi:hypothetical protein E2C01_049430 [Portunus trituberculatus]|uniref:Uncharacterized protein n=1 Tax=Portunus trituberculatus TaxID=210409 RepID=A0A5B7G9F2_PORTR|nr:hypothetical protein [Portunus trituberculatus]